jgi:hypothetical protein
LNNNSVLFISSDKSFCCVVLLPGCLLFGGLLLSGCGTRLYNVASRPVALPAESEVAATSPAGFSITASAFTEDDAAWQQFGANLPLAGIVAVRVNLLNNTTISVNLKKLKFVLRDDAGKQFKPIAPKKVIKRLLKFQGTRLYGLEAYRNTRTDYEAIALPIDLLASQQQRSGLLFFEAKRDVLSVPLLHLEIKGSEATGKSPLTIRLKNN